MASSNTTTTGGETSSVTSNNDSGGDDAVKNHPAFLELRKQADDLYYYKEKLWKERKSLREKESQLASELCMANREVTSLRRLLNEKTSECNAMIQTSFDHGFNNQRLTNHNKTLIAANEQQQLRLAELEAQVRDNGEKWNKVVADVQTELKLAREMAANSERSRQELQLEVNRFDNMFKTQKQSCEMQKAQQLRINELETRVAALEKEKSDIQQELDLTRHNAATKRNELSEEFNAAKEANRNLEIQLVEAKGEVAGLRKVLEEQANEHRKQCTSLMAGKKTLQLRVAELEQQVKNVEEVKNSALADLHREHSMARQESAKRRQELDKKVATLRNALEMRNREVSTMQLNADQEAERNREELDRLKKENSMRNREIATLQLNADREAERNRDELDILRKENSNLQKEIQQHVVDALARRREKRQKLEEEVITLD